jgi:UMF1 family MFS transporter
MTAFEPIPMPTPDGERISDRRERVGWYFYDWANSAFSTVVVTVFLRPYLGVDRRRCRRRLRPGVPARYPRCGRLAVSVALSLSVFLQVFVLPTVGAVADRSAHNKQLLALFAYLGSAATAALVFLTGDRYLLGAALLIIANVAFSARIVVYNSFLPQLAGPDQHDSVSASAGRSATSAAGCCRPSTWPRCSARTPSR